MAITYNLKLSEIFNDFLLTIEDNDYISSANPALVWSVMKRGAREINSDVGGTLKSVKRDVESTTSLVTLPNGVISISKVAFADSDGLLYLLKENTNLAINPQTSGSSSFPTEGFSSGSSDEALNDIVFHNYLLDGNYGQLYGRGGGSTHGQYRVNYIDQVIYLDTSNDYGEVYIEYVSDPVLEDDPIVHAHNEEALRNYTYYKLISTKSSVPGGEKARARKDYFNELRRAKSRFTTFNKQEAMVISRKNFKLSPKS